MAGMYLTSRYNYLLFHSLVEMFSVFVACGIFVVAWHTRELSSNSYILLLGFGYLSAGMLDLLHTLSYSGMGVLPVATANVPTQLWIQARSVEALCLLLAPLAIRRRIHVSIPLLVCVCSTVGPLWITFATNLFPACYIEGEGLTPFKRGSEYVICAVLLCAAAVHYARRRDLDPGVLKPMLGSIVLTVLAELAFTRYFSVDGPANAVGHLLKMASFVPIYGVVVAIGLAKPREALRESEANLRAFIDGTPDAMCIRDLDRRLILWNGAFARAVRANCGVDVCAGMRAEDYVPQEMLGKLTSERDSLHRALAGELRHAEFALPCPDGVTRFFETGCFPVRKGDDIVAVAEITRDVTERRMAENEARQHRDVLAHLDRVSRMGELAVSLAHELNQPLTGILSNAQAARMYLDRDAPDLELFREILDDIVEDDKRASEVIRRLRAFLTEGRQEAAPVDVNDLVRETVEVLRSETVIQRVTVAVDLARDLPALMADRIQLQQVLINLCVNAERAMADIPSGQRELVIRTQPDDAGNVRICVRDRGPGISSTALDRIFDPFYSTESGGMGMGLAISRSIIAAHGGRIWAENVPDGGAAMWIELPASVH